ncbi:hypothetical protein Avbf_00857 [Armadillidium vulgare]|nr:hypothetical protein Avbf_00857 [Armadillidium vulgare]
MSQTLNLERTYDWKGLLIEPDPRSFQSLVSMKRNAWLSPLCVKVGFPAANRYWLRRLETNLPHHFQQLLLARSKLENEILEGDEERGTFITVPCSPLSSILKAINVSTVDLLTVNTGGDEDLKKVSDVIKSKKFHVKFLLLHYSSNLLFNDPFPEVPGYIADTKRSFLLMKLYVRAANCQLIKQDACQNIESFSVVKACNTYICFGYLKVLSSH